MTAGSNGVPEEDDPFGYLYRPAGGEGAQDEAAPAAPQQPGVPRTSYAHPTQVGRAQYGQPRAPQQGYGQAVPPQSAPYAQGSRPQPEPGGGHGGRSAGRKGPNRGLIFGGIAVVAAIAIGAGVAVMGGDDDPSSASAQASAGGAASGASSAGASGSESPSKSPSQSAASTKPVVDASGLEVRNGTLASSIKGADSSDGKYVTLQQGTTITWQVQVASGGQHEVWVHYDNPGSDATATVSVNGKPNPGGPIKLKNYDSGSGPSDAWYGSNVWPTLQSGTNTVVLSCDNASCAGLQVDQLAVTAMGVDKFPS